MSLYGAEIDDVFIKQRLDANSSKNTVEAGSSIVLGTLCTRANLRCSAALFHATDICRINYISVNAPSDRSSVSVTTVGHCSPG